MASPGRKGRGGELVAVAPSCGRWIPTSGGRLRRRAGPYDDRMPRTQQPSSRRPAGRGLTLLVLAVLAGVLAMHGLGPGPAPTSAPASGHVMVTAHEEAAQHVTAHEAAQHMTGACSHTDGGAGHADHADATCAAAGVGASYAPPVLGAALDGGFVSAGLPGGAAGTPESGRAPPDLAELQLLRI